VNDGFFDTAKSHGVNCVHLISGEDIFGEVFEDQANGVFVIKKPVIPHVAFYQPNGRFHVSLLPLRPYLGEVTALPIPPDKIIFIVKLGPESEKRYLEFTSNIILAPAGSVPTAGGPGGLPMNPSIQLR